MQLNGELLEVEDIMDRTTKIRTSWKLVFTGAVAAVVAASASASAQVAHPNAFDGGNRWLITAFDDSSPGHTTMATQGICFLPYVVVGTHIRGVWYSDTFPNWNGKYSQEGDRILMHGDYANNIGHDGILNELFGNSGTQSLGAGQWTEWRENAGTGNTIVFANSRLRRVGSCQPVTGATDQASLDTLAEQRSSVVPPRRLRSGQLADNPLERDQTPIMSVVLIPPPPPEDTTFCCTADECHPVDLLTVCGDAFKMTCTSNGVCNPG